MECSYKKGSLNLMGSFLDAETIESFLAAEINNKRGLKGLKLDKTILNYVYKKNGESSKLKMSCEEFFDNDENAFYVTVKAMREFKIPELSKKAKK